MIVKRLKAIVSIFFILWFVFLLVKVAFGGVQLEGLFSNRARLLF
jgi:hypothetical protein